ITGSSGTFTLTFNGQTTPPLPFNAPAAQVQAALNALSSVGRAEVQDVTVSGIGGTFTLTFNGQTTAPLPFDATAAQVQAALNQLTSVARSEVQTVTITGLPGTFTLTFNGQTTAPLPYNATAAQVQAALNALSSFGTIGGTATVTSTPVAGGTQYAIAFGATLANYDQPEITATTTGAISAAVATPTQGLGGTTVVTATPVSGGIRYRVTFGGVLGNSDLPPMAAAGAGGATAGVAPVQDGGGAGSVTVTRSVIAGGYDYTIAFGGNLANANQPQISVATVGGNAGRVVTTLDGPEGTTVNPGATLQVAGGITMPANTGEVVTINGPGFGTLGALDSAGGNNTWATPLYLGSDASIGTATAADTLTFTAPIVDNVPNNPSPFNLSVVGPGTVVYNATVDNQYTGTTTVLGGVLLLSQASGTAIVGPLVIGTGPDPAKVLYDVNSSNQIADDAPVAVDFNGTLDLAGNSDAIDALTVRSGLVLTGPGGVLAPNSVSMTGGTITIGAGGTLRMNGNLFAISTGTTPARINGTGNLDLNGTDRAFNVANGPGVDDLVISSGVVATGGGRLVKTGAGRLTFDPTTPVTATVTSQGGDVRVLTAIGSVELATGSLSGSGTVTRITGAGGNGPAVGRIDPGVDGTGVLTSTGPVTWGANTRLFLNLDAVNHPVPIVGVEYDQFRVTGTGDITLGGAVLDGTVAAGVQVGDKFTVVDATGTTGRVIGRFAEPFGPGVVFIGGQKFTVDYSDPQKVVLTRVLAAVTVGLSSSANPSATGQPVTFTATVTPEPGSGSIPPGTTVVFTFDSTNSPAIPVTVLPNGTGTASWTPPVSLLTNGSHTVTALFSGDSVLFGAATAAPLTQVVNTVVIAPITLTPTSPTANVPFISPSITPGVQDGITISTAVSGQLSPLTWTVRIAQGATTVRTYTGTSGPLSGNTTYPISVTWDGKNTGGAFVADGAYTVTASFTDANSNTGTTAPATVRVDNTRPVPSAVTSSETIINAGPTAGQVPVSTRLTASVSEANLDTWTLAVKNSLGATVRTFAGTTTTVDVTWDGKDTGGAAVADDTYTFSLTAIDKAGNPSAAAGA
ncbi:MAG: Ig-like domain-containing protein, partial [Gemmataceae bacterium]|nr:Ig-like domain-containing protein [Gemmataceae bacterium]